MASDHIDPFSSRKETPFEFASNSSNDNSILYKQLSPYINYLNNIYTEQNLPDYSGFLRSFGFSNRISFTNLFSCLFQITKEPKTISKRSFKRMNDTHRSMLLAFFSIKYKDETFKVLKKYYKININHQENTSASNAVNHQKNNNNLSLFSSSPIYINGKCQDKPPLETPNNSISKATVLSINNSESVRESEMHPDPFEDQIDIFSDDQLSFFL